MSTFAEFLRDETDAAKPDAVEADPDAPDPTRSAGRTAAVERDEPAADDGPAAESPRDAKVHAATSISSIETPPPPQTVTGIDVLPGSPLAPTTAAPIAPVDLDGTPPAHETRTPPWAIAPEAAPTDGVVGKTDDPTGDAPAPSGEDPAEAPPVASAPPPAIPPGPQSGATTAPPTAAQAIAANRHAPRGKPTHDDDHRWRPRTRGVKQRPEETDDAPLVKPRHKPIQDQTGSAQPGPVPKATLSSSPENAATALAGGADAPGSPVSAPLPAFEALKALVSNASGSGSSPAPDEDGAPAPAAPLPAPSLSTQPGAEVAPQGQTLRAVDHAASAARTDAAADLMSPARFERLLDQLHGELQTGKNEFKLRLDPPDLGRLDVRIVSHGDGVVVHLTAERSDVAQWLRTDLPILHRSVEKDGLHVLGVEVQSWLDHDARGRQGHRETEKLFDEKPSAAPRGVKAPKGSSPIARSTAIQAAGVDLLV